MFVGRSEIGRDKKEGEIMSKASNWSIDEVASTIKSAEKAMEGLETLGLIDVGMLPSALKYHVAQKLKVLLSLYDEDKLEQPYPYPMVYESAAGTCGKCGAPYTYPDAYGAPVPSCACWNLPQTMTTTDGTGLIMDGTGLAMNDSSDGKREK